ncbi:hypothetical protein FBU30_010532 [Linnemannia zychae]|nr:hypothetical protein FBU30_010532 [Linnemannia zychae]
MSFRFGNLSIITIFHNPSLRTSKTALALLQKKSRHYKFELDLVQSKTKQFTHEQVNRMVECLGNGSIEEGLGQILIPELPKPSTIKEVQRILDANPAHLRKPLVVDWNRGMAVIADVGARKAMLNDATPPEVLHEFTKGVNPSKK